MTEEERCSEADLPISQKRNLCSILAPRCSEALTDILGADFAFLPRIRLEAGLVQSTLAKEVRRGGSHLCDHDTFTISPSRMLEGILPRSDAR